ncbi:hypothetical protein ACFOW6_13415 [Fodinicurvata halophila]|uniref:ParB/Sulfiredoxin domain-containing protein n=1 Tax=Fodinicurvata halophila TaxID=1419723 RepID=A0ABV8UN62_9PROT
MTDSREAQITQACETAAEGTQFVLFRGGYRELPVVRLPLELPLYRPENGRIISELQALLARKGWTGEAFRRDVAADWVQGELHALLLELARDARGPIYQELAAQAQQTEPLLITRSGLVVNGNRRLAAMRALHAEDPRRYAGFARLRAAVLPPETTDADIEYVESALQLAPETKLAYSWTNRRLKLRRQRDELDLPLDAILESYRLPDQAALEVELEELALAERYLADYLGRPGAYAEIADDEAGELFVALTQRLKALKGPLREAWLWAGFAMIHTRGEAGQKLLNGFPFAEPQPEWAPPQALFELAQAEGLADSSQAELTPELSQRLADLLCQPEVAERCAQQLADSLDQIRIDANRQAMPEKLLKNLQQARKFAERLEPERLSPRQKARIGSELAAVQYHSRRFLEAQADAPPPVSPLWRKLRKLPGLPGRLLRGLRGG